MSYPRKNLLLFFDRPTEPCFMRKGDDNIRFNVPESYYCDQYKNLVNILKNTINDDKHGCIDVADISLPDMTEPKALPKNEQFSFFVPRHRQIAGKLIDIFMNASTLKELESIFAYCQLNINPYLFNYCAAVAILHRKDTKGMVIPTFAETFPDRFVDKQCMRSAREFCHTVPEETKIPIVKVDLSPNPKLPEQRLAYFREDVGINSHHWHWHLIYPTDATNSLIVRKDRRGELFYYMHHQITARYNVERMCNGLARTKPYDNFREPIAEGYFPLLESGNSNRPFAPRFDNIAVYDIDRPGNKIKASIADMEIWRERILDTIENQSFLQVDESIVPLDEETGIDILGNLVEATAISENPIHYGDYHNKGHMLIAYLHDPDEYHSQQHSVMGDSATAMRDPVFYRWHAHIDNIFKLYKDKLRPYSNDELVFPAISESSIKIESVNGQNTINTLWERSTVNLKNAMEFSRRRDVYAEFTHLQHEEFNYVIEVFNNSGAPQVGTVRIYMAPTVDEEGKPLSFDEQRNLMIEMDKFSHPLTPGSNTIRRSSMDSSVTIPFERIFRDHNGQKSSSETSGVNYCDCGWPQYLLVPKGNTEGYPMVVLVMVSNWKEDKVGRDLTGADNDNASFCGLRDHKYPDKRAMGFPFDRRPTDDIDSLDKFLKPNMAIQNLTIKFTDTIRDRGQKPLGK